MDAWRCAQVGGQRIGILAGGGQLEAALGVDVRLDSLLNLDLGFLAKARNLPDAAIAGGAVKLFRGLDVELMPQRADPLGAEAGNFEQLGDRWRKLMCEPGLQRALARRCNFANLGGQVGANAWQVGNRFA